MLAFIDLDGFKQVNDQYGHAAGDDVLAEFAAEAQRVFRNDDCFARLGGDEFAVLIAVPSVAEARAIAEQLHQRLTLALSTVKHPVTCSMGALVVQPKEHMPLAELIRAADSLMYTVKKLGKNNVRIARASRSSHGHGYKE